MDLFIKYNVKRRDVYDKWNARNIGITFYPKTKLDFDRHENYISSQVSLVSAVFRSPYKWDELKLLTKQSKNCQKNCSMTNLEQFSDSSSANSSESSSRAGSTSRNVLVEQVLTELPKSLALVVELFSYSQFASRTVIRVGYRPVLITLLEPS